MAISDTFPDQEYPDREFASVAKVTEALSGWCVWGEARPWDTLRECRPLPLALRMDTLWVGETVRVTRTENGWWEGAYVHRAQVTKLAKGQFILHGHKAVFDQTL